MRTDNKTLELKSWTVQPHYPYTPLMDRSIETGVKLRGILDEMPIRVPESIYTVLCRNGFIEDPTRDMNSIKAEWVSQRWWLYRCEFSVGDVGAGFGCYLNFGCVDYHCYVFLNGTKLGEHSGACESFGFEVGGLLRERNELSVLVDNSLPDRGQIGYTDKVDFQRPRYDYKWDFCPRLVNIGIYRPVTLRFYDKLRIEGAVFETEDYEKRQARLDLYVEGEEGDYTAELSLNDGRTLYSESFGASYDGKGKISLRFCVPEAELWYPNNVGNRALYRLSVKLFSDGKPCDSTEKTVGFRQIVTVRNEGAPESALPYTFVVNGKRTYIKGFNITPTDFLLGNETREKYEMLVKSARDANANMIRVWGGGIIEQDIFYELCSEYGIMVWQDMIQSSSGLSNVPSEDPDFVGKVVDTTRFALLHRGTYPCLAVICGGNELFGRDGRPVTTENKNVAAICEFVKKTAPHMIFITSTASGPVQSASLEHSELNHDIHGPWLYMGSDSHFDYYNRLKCLFAGEFGCNGMSSLKSLGKFLSEKHLVSTCVDEDVVWRHHGEVWDSFWWVKELFGRLNRTEDLITVSQYLQKVGLEYGIYMHRKNSFYQSGCMIWQLNEMFPNVFSTALIDYYGEKKPAYYAAKRAYSGKIVFMKFDKMIFAPDEKNTITVYALCDEVNDVACCVDVYENGKKIAEYEGEAQDVSACRELKTFTVTMPEEGYVLVEVKAKSEGKEYGAEAIFTVRDKSGLCSKEAVKVMEKINTRLCKELAE